MSNLVVLLESQPLLSLFLVIGLGYAAGEIAFRGFSLDVGSRRRLPRIIIAAGAMGALLWLKARFLWPWAAEA